MISVLTKSIDLLNCCLTSSRNTVDALCTWQQTNEDNSHSLLQLVKIRFFFSSGFNLRLHPTSRRIFLQRSYLTKDGKQSILDHRQKEKNSEVSLPQNVASVQGIHLEHTIGCLTVTGKDIRPTALPMLYPSYVSILMCRKVSYGGTFKSMRSYNLCSHPEYYPFS